MTRPRHVLLNNSDIHIAFPTRKGGLTVLRVVSLQICAGVTVGTPPRGNRFGMEMEMSHTYLRGRSSQCPNPGFVPQYEALSSSFLALAAFNQRPRQE